MLSRRSVVLVPIFAPIAASTARTEVLAPADLVLVRQGTLPIILTVPHGGREAIPGVAPRDTAGKPSGGRGFVTGTDTNTDKLALGIAAEVKALTGKEPYLVMAKFKRKFVDPNRPTEVAVDSPAARPYYDYYHRAVRRFIDEVRAKYPAGLLVDVHGQKKDPTVVMRGTQNGRTVARLVERAGVTAVTGPNGIFGATRRQRPRRFPGKRRGAGRHRREPRLQRRLHGRDLQPERGRHRCRADGVRHPLSPRRRPRSRRPGHR